MRLTENRLRVVHIPQVPMKGFAVDVMNEREAFLIDHAFANQHLFLLEKNVIPEYSNVIFVQMWDENLEPDKDGEKWTDYYNEHEDMEWEEFTKTYTEYVTGTTKP